MVFLVAAIIFIAKNLTSFLIVDIFIEGYMLIASTDAIVTLSLIFSNHPSLSFSSDALTMETCGYFTLALSNVLFIPVIYFCLLMVDGLSYKS